MKANHELKSGDVIGYLTLQTRISEKYKSGTKVFWECKCICGKIVTRRNDYLFKTKINFINRISSCGCKNPAYINLGNQNPKWKGYQEISATAFTQLKRHAKDRNIEVKITMEDMWNQYIKQDKKCALTGQKLIIKQSNRTHNIENSNASLDRIDSTKDYTPDNIQWIHKDINFMKNDLSQEEFLKNCKLVYDFMNLQKEQKV